MKFLRLRIPPPIAAVFFGLLIWGLSRLLSAHSLDPEIRQIIAMVLIGMAAAIDIWALFSFRQVKTTIDPRYPHKSSSIVKSGIYRYTRNPMYLGLALILSALSVYLGAKFGFFIVAAFVLYMNEFQIKPEEDVLEKNFGEEYLAYKSKVRRWL